MTRNDQQVLFTALAFLAILLKDGDGVRSDSANRVKRLASLFEDFCLSNGAHSDARFSDIFCDAGGSAELDAAIDHHINNLRQNHETCLPEDRATLLKFYDRLQQRKSRRMQQEFYACATETKIADLVLHYLDEEIEYAEAQS